MLNASPTQVSVSSIESITSNFTTETAPTVALSDDGLSSDRSGFNVFVIALSVIQNEVTYDCRRIATLMLSGFLVVGILCKWMFSHIVHEIKKHEAIYFYENESVWKISSWLILFRRRLVDSAFVEAK